MEPIKYVAGDKTFTEMWTMLQAPEFRQPAEMCIRRQASFHSVSDKPGNAALAKGVLSNQWMDIEAIMAAVSTDPEGHLTIGNDAKMFEIVEKVWPLVASARYQGVVNPPPTTYRTVPQPPGAVMPTGTAQYRTSKERR